MKWRLAIVIILSALVLALYNLPLTVGVAKSGRWLVPVWGFLPASILYFILWLVVAVPVAWLLMRWTWRDAV